MIRRIGNRAKENSLRVQLTLKKYTKKEGLQKYMGSRTGTFSIGEETLDDIMSKVEEVLEGE